MSDSDQIRRAVVQKLESLHRSGCQAIPRPRLAYQTAETGAPTSHTASTTKIPTAAAAPVASMAPSRIQHEAETTCRHPDWGPVLHPAKRSPALAVLADEVAGCTKCLDLVNSRRQTVFGVGNPNSRLVFFGEAPGADEDRLGEPFVGKAGQLLTKIIEACTFKREDVYIMNVLKCRPPANRNPTPEEASNCRAYFERQFEIIRPEFICCLGAIAATTLLDTTATVGQLRGRFHHWRGIRVVVTYHPAYLLRNAAAKKMVWADMKMLMSGMGVEL